MSLKKVNPNLKLSRRGLTICLATMVGSGLLVYSIFPESVGGPDLPISVDLQWRPVETLAGDGKLVTEVVVITNRSEKDIARVDIEVNGQYLLFREPPLRKNEELTLPLRVLTDKRSSQRYDPARYPPTEVIVKGQLPSGTRGVSQFEFSRDHLKAVQ